MAGQMVDMLEMLIDDKAWCFIIRQISSDYHDTYTQALIQICINLTT